MELAIAALSCLLPKLSSLLINEYNLQKGVRGQIKFLMAEMETIQATVKDLSRRPADCISDVDKLWVRDLKELSYDIEDSVDAFIVCVDDGPDKPRSSLAGFRKFIDKIGHIGKAKLVKKAKTRHRSAVDLEDIKTRVLEVAERRKRYPVPDLITAQPNTNAIIDPRITALFEDVANLVGIGGPAEKLTNLLTQRRSSKQKLLVASIVGVGGLGKTTLANFVYTKLRGQFQCQAFVSVSLKPDIKKILSSILRQVTRGNCTNAGEMDTGELIRSIREFLNSKRYFIVIDDLWDESAWDIIRCALIDNNHGSRVIVTTRNLDVGKLSSTSDIRGALYELQPLSDTDSKKLFYKRVFGKEDGVDNELHEVAGKILKKCGGVPLAIITIASLLASKSKTSYEWYGVYKSIGSGLYTDKSMENMRAIISLSYYELPPYLKPCSLYLCIFPEDCDIGKDSLVRRWVAEGLVTDRHGKNLYDLAEAYFNELVDRSLIHPLLDSNNIDGKAEAYRVHDMVLDLLISVSTEENFVSRSDCQDCQELIAPLCKIRRLSLQGSKENNSNKDQEILPETVDVSHVRSAIAFDDAFKRMPPLSRFSVVRVLDLDGFPSRNNHLKGLGRLHQLRYLRVRGHLEKDLLEEIGSLQFLKTLDLSGAIIEELPAGIGQLRQLECLLVYIFLKLPDWFRNLRSLQELSCLNDSSSPNTLAELGNLTQLRVLSIAGLEESGVKTFLKSLSKLGNIRTINFFREGLVSLDCLPDGWRVPARLQRISGGFLTFCRVPRWFSSLLELSSLSIHVKELRQDDFRLMGALPVLRFLELAVSSIDPVIDERLVIGIDQPFRSLVGFGFEHWSRCWLVFARGAMRELQRLHLYADVHRTGEEGLDIGLENLTSLEHVTIRVFGDVSKREEQDALIKARGAVKKHPNHPTLKIGSRCRTR